MNFSRVSPGCESVRSTALYGTAKASAWSSTPSLFTTCCPAFRMLFLSKLQMRPVRPEKSPTHGGAVCLPSPGQALIYIGASVVGLFSHGSDVSRGQNASGIGGRAGPSPSSASRGPGLGLNRQFAQATGEVTEAVIAHRVIADVVQEALSDLLAITGRQRHSGRAARLLAVC